MKKSSPNSEFIHDMLVAIDARLDDLSEISIRHDENLKMHMARSEANEQSIELLKRHVNMVNGVGAFIVFLSVVATIYAAVK